MSESNFIELKHVEHPPVFGEVGPAGRECTESHRLPLRLDGEQRLVEFLALNADKFFDRKDDKGRQSFIALMRVLETVSFAYLEHCRNDKVTSFLKKVVASPDSQKCARDLAQDILVRLIKSPLSSPTLPPAPAIGG